MTNTRIVLSLIGIASLACAACSEDPVTGGDPIDPTLPIAPCDSGYVSAVGANGFILSGSGYRAELVRFTNYQTSVEYLFDDTANAVRTSVTATIALPDDQSTQTILDVQIPDVKPGVYTFNTLPGSRGAYVRLELRKSSGTRIYQSLTGQITLDSFVNNAQPYGRFCGIFKDSVINSRVALMSGRFSPE